MPIATLDPPTQPHEPATIRVRSETDDIVSLYLCGEFDAFNAAQITDHAFEALEADKHVVLDLSDTMFIDVSVVSALAAIHAASEECGRSAVLQLGTAPIVERVIAITGIEDVLPRVETRSEAIARIRAPAGS